MTVRTYRYRAYRMKQTPDSEPLLLFSAHALEIEAWAGIPQRGRLGGGETVGFQRQENDSRVRELAGFFNEPRNVVQNPLLCALQNETSVVFNESVAGSEFGELEITAEALSELTLLALIQKVIAGLEARMPNLAAQPIDQARLAEVVRCASELHDLAALEESDADTDEPDYENDEDEEAESDDDESAGDVASVLLTEETQLVDFYQELKVRADVLGRLSSTTDLDELLGFSKDAMISYLQPVVLVDGQHRLRGAITSAKMAAESAKGREEVRRAIDEGVEADAG